MPKTRIQKKSNGQYVVTVPKSIAESMNLEEKRVNWEIKSSKAIRLEVVED